MTERQETVAEILAEMRQPPAIESHLTEMLVHVHRGWSDRLEAAIKRLKKPCPRYHGDNKP